MICEHCGNIVREGATVCDQCGAQIVPSSPHAGGRRQGRPEQRQSARYASAAPERSEPLLPDAVLSNQRRPRSERADGAGRPLNRRGTPPQPTTGKQMRREHAPRTHAVHRMMINWALVWTIIAVLCVLLAAGGYIFLKRTDAGQLILARMGKDANASALWRYGQELLDQGYIDRSITAFTTAYALEPEREDIYTKLQLLAEAYEAAGNYGAAEEVYTTLYTDIAPENPAAYRAVVRLLEDQNRRLELSSFLKLAYEKTGDISFNRQRDELLPAIPETSLQGGSLKRERDVTLTSAEDYDIYYILDGDGVLPDDGVLYTSPIHLAEGSHTLRAVAVSNDLISDEMSVKYNISLPVPVAPKSSLQPGSYGPRQRIWLRYDPPKEDKLSEDEKQKDITIYYTIDGQTPTANSPIYTGEPFFLPGGKKVVVKAVAVNGYGKASNTMEVEYQVNAPFKYYFNEKDEFGDFTLMKTTRDAFVKKYGAPAAENEITDSLVSGLCVSLTYAWGEARFTMTDKGYVLYYIDTASASMAGPRKTKLGMEEEKLTALFRDMGQAYNQNGDRSLYWDESAGYGKIVYQDIVREYVEYFRKQTDGNTTTLRYQMENKKVTRITMFTAY